MLSLLSLLLALALSTSFVAAQNCATDQNPYCKGNKIFEQICCPYPNVCYWQDRSGTPGCCPAGQVCGTNGNNPPVTIVPSPAPTITITPTTRTVTQGGGNGGGGGIVIITTNAPGPSTITITTQGVCNGGGCSTVTSFVGGVYSTITSDVGGAFSTVTSVVGGAYSTVSGVLVGNGAEHAVPAMSVMMGLGMGIGIFLLMV
jgi:hypothetical protein